MYVFIDDSGDTGFKFDEGSSTHVVLAACIFDTSEHIKHAVSLIDGSRIKGINGWREYRYEREYKYHRTKATFKKDFFNAVKPANYYVRTIIIDKRIIYSPNLKSDPEYMKGFMLEQLLTHTFDTVKEAKVIIDGEDRQALGLAKESDRLRAAVNRQCPGTIREVEFVDSKESSLIQLADMTAGAIRRAQLGEKQALIHMASFRDRLLQPRGTKWHFR